MINVSNVQVFNFEGAIRGMRNPMNSWDKSDSHFISKEFCETDDELKLAIMCGGTAPIIGENDLALMNKLAKAGTEHRKYLRQIFVSMDITAPMYWFSEYDTYKVGTVANSTSKMHKLHARDLRLDDFSHEHIEDAHGTQLLLDIIDLINEHRKYFIAETDPVIKKKHWWHMIQLLPESYNQTRTVTMNYENVLAMIHQRENHKLDEWNLLVEKLKKLPYIEELINV